MFIIVAYDIRDNKRRRKVHKRLKNYLTHIQGSVFEGKLNELRLSKMVKSIIKFIDDSEDSLRVWKLPERMLKDVIVMGLPELTKSVSTIVV
jgi:CRISPR-associated protein Cas2